MRLSNQANTAITDATFPISRPSQVDPQDWYKSLHNTVIAESISNRIVSNADLFQLDGPNMRRHFTPKDE